MQLGTLMNVGHTNKYTLFAVALFYFIIESVISLLQIVSLHLQFKKLRIKMNNLYTCKIHALIKSSFQMTLKYKWSKSQ